MALPLFSVDIPFLLNSPITAPPERHQGPGKWFRNNLNFGNEPGHAKHDLGPFPLYFYEIMILNKD